MVAFWRRAKWLLIVMLVGLGACNMHEEASTNVAVTPGGTANTGIGSYPSAEGAGNSSGAVGHDSSGKTGSGTEAGR